MNLRYIILIQQDGPRVNRGRVGFGSVGLWLAKGPLELTISRRGAALPRVQRSKLGRRALAFRRRLKYVVGGLRSKSPKTAARLELK